MITKIITEPALDRLSFDFTIYGLSTDGSAVHHNSADQNDIVASIVGLADSPNDVLRIVTDFDVDGNLTLLDFQGIGGSNVKDLTVFTDISLDTIKSLKTAIEGKNLIPSPAVYAKITDVVGTVSPPITEPPILGGGGASVGP